MYFFFLFLFWCLTASEQWLKTIDGSNFLLFFLTTITNLTPKNPFKQEVLEYRFQPVNIHAKKQNEHEAIHR